MKGHRLAEGFPICKPAQKVRASTMGQEEALCRKRTADVGTPDEELTQPGEGTDTCTRIRFRPSKDIQIP